MKECTLVKKSKGGIYFRLGEKNGKGQKWGEDFCPQEKKKGVPKDKYKGTLSVKVEIDHKFQRDKYHFKVLNNNNKKNIPRVEYRRIFF